MTPRDQPFPVDELRREFPALTAADSFLFFDNAAGAQVPRRALDAVAEHLVARNVQRGGLARTPRTEIERFRVAVSAHVRLRKSRA